MYFLHMRTFLKSIACLMMTSLLHQACYDDKGNYNYQVINTVEVDLPEMKVRMPKEEAVEVVVTPVISQTLEQKEANLEYQWRILKSGKEVGSINMDDYESFATGKECKVTIEPLQDTDVGVLLVVHDRINGTKWYKTGKISIVKPFNPCWFVLQEKDGKGLLGAVEGKPSGYYIFPDLFQSERKEDFPLQGKPLSIYARREYGNKQAAQMFSFRKFTANPALMIATDQGASLFTPSTLETRYASDKVLFDAVDRSVSYYKMARHGDFYITSKKTWFAAMDGFSVPFSIRTSDSEEPIAVSAYGSGYSSAIFFDKGKRRFLKKIGLQLFDFMSVPSQPIRVYNSPWSDKHTILREIEVSGTQANVFDPNQVDPNLDIKDIVSGSYGNYLYAIASDVAGKNLTVFQFSEIRGEAACFAQYQIGLPSETDLSSARFAASFAYVSNLLFMSSGNGVYRIDLDRKKVTKVYEYEDKTAVISCLKFKDPENLEEYGMSLGLGVNGQNGNYVVELQMTPSGDVSKAENSICVYKDAANPFAKIVDITFNYE